MGDFSLDKNFKNLADPRILSNRVERTFDQLTDQFNQNADTVSASLTKLTTETNLIPGIQSSLSALTTTVGGLSTLVRVSVPSSSSATGVIGQYAVDTTNGIFYFCYATNAWLQITAGTSF